MTDELVVWLRACLDEDQRGAEAATQGRWFWADHSTMDFPQGDGSLLADQGGGWKKCDYHCTWAGESNLHRGEPGRPGHEHLASEEVIGAWGYDASGITVSEHDAAHIARHDPARVLAEVAAKRRIIDEWQKYEDEMRGLDSPQEFGVQQGLEFALRLLASVYRGRPGWRSEWAPDGEATT